MLLTQCWTRLEQAATLAGEDDRDVLAMPTPLFKPLAPRAERTSVYKRKQLRIEHLGVNGIIWRCGIGHCC